MTKTTTPAAETTKTTRVRKTRQPVKPLNKTPEAVAANAKAEQARKKASKKALREALKPVKIVNVNAVADSDADESEVIVRTVERDRGAENLAAARIEADATGMSFEEACASMGIDATTGQPIAQAKTGYAGPMLALRTAVKNYKKAPNGQPCCGDTIATLCGEYSRETVVKALIAALGLPSNPYAHLNPGQQSMNLRNKARAALKSGLITEADIDANLRTQSALAMTEAN